MNPTIKELCLAADSIDAILKRLDRIQQHAGEPASSVAAFGRLQLERVSQKLMDTCDEISAKPDDFPP